MAFASAQRRRRNESAAGLAALAGVLVVLAASAALLAMFLWPMKPDLTGVVVQVGNLEAIPLRQPVYFAEGEFWLVKLDKDTVIALSAKHPHSRGCDIEWKPEFTFNRQTGWFRDPCLGATFDLAGNRIYGPAPRGMDRYEVAIGKGLGGSTTLRVLADEHHLFQASPRSYLDDPVRP